GELGEAFSHVTQGKGKGQIDAATFLQGMHAFAQHLQPHLSVDLRRPSKDMNEQMKNRPSEVLRLNK
ncbi:unnamed protein product, partial [Prorocentrum cordatum]